jgi:predicted DsbA family dithiol-disulfide isomerase
MELYFTEGADLSDREVLVKAAADSGLDANAVRAALATEADVPEITKAAEAANAAGIQGVPFFIIGGKYGVSGAQAPEQLAAAIEQAAREPAAA